MPFSPLYFLLFLFLLAGLIAFIQLGLVTFTFEKLGLSPDSAVLLLLTSLIGSGINLPLFSIKASPPPVPFALERYGLLRRSRQPFTGKTIIAINVGGCLVPLFFSGYLLMHNPLNILMLLLGVFIVAIVCYLMSRPVPGIGIGMPMLVAPVTAALVALLLGDEQSAAFAYISGTFGVLLGADILRLNDIRKMGAPIASIGGAGTFDGIFITGWIAVLLT